MKTQTQTHSPALDALLAGYAVGTLEPALHALVGAHLELSPANRAFVQSLESSLSADVATLPPCAIHRRQERLSEIFAAKPAYTSQPGANTLDPKALRHFLGAPIETLPFKTVMPGLREYRVPAGEGINAMLYRIKPGRRMPQHTHSGTEITLVLRGCFVDETGHYGRGDIAIADEDIDHDPVAGPDEECVCFAIVDAPLRLTGPIGRLIGRFIGH